MTANHPSIAHSIRELDRRALLAAVVDDRRAAQAQRAADPGRSLTATARRHLGRALVVVAQRLQAARTAGEVAPVGSVAVR